MSKKNSWMMCIVGTVLCLACLVVVPQWVWIPLPFAFTGLAKAFDAI
jgi:hypothetical protein